MTDKAATADPGGPTGSTWRFSRPFWIANIVELLERGAWYGVFIAITLYLSRILGFDDIQAGVISGLFSAGLYLLPPFSGALADRMGFRAALLLAFGLLTIGYGLMWVLPVLLQNAGLVTYGQKVTFTGLEQTGYKWLFIPVMLVIMVGGSFIKSVITGTVATETNAVNRARGYSIFYAMVNIGSFSGKTIVKPLRDSMGDQGLVTLNLFSAGATLLAFLAVFAFYKGARQPGTGKTMGEIWRSLVAVCTRLRLVVLILIITGFWLVQGQLYATMPKYVLRMAGEGAAFAWYANVNPAAVVLTVAWVTQLMKRYSALTSMTVGMLIMPISAFAMAAGNVVGSGHLLGMHPVAFMMVVGIAFQGLAESFISPRFLEYFSLQAPKGQEGLYLGFSHLHSFLSYIVGFAMSGVMLDKWCPDPSKMSPEVQAQHPEAIAGRAPLPAEYAHAHYIWFVFVAIALASAIALVIFGRGTRARDARAAAAGG